jgi:predicted nuclease with RNAse H fold
LLKLSAIVWYEHPSERFAMINGMKANEGSVIEGVKVVEIHPTSVRFLYNGQHFEISMSK